jgi:hypothetical protein
MQSAIIALCLAGASAFVPIQTVGRVATQVSAREYGKYDDGMWDNNAKIEIYEAWDPSAPRSANNFNPFETWDGNSPDASGIFPGETGYKDPQRGDISFQIMMDQRKEAEERAANPKAGSAPGCPGCRT